MFTGIIQSIGKITDVAQLKDQNVLIIEAKNSIFDNLKKGASVSVDGICLTLEEHKNNRLSFKVMDETVKLTNLKFAKDNKAVNLEPAMKMGGSFDGHIVQGHIDAIGKTISIKQDKNQTVIKFSYPKEFAKHLALKGSIAINGASLTISYLDRETFDVCLVEHTLKNTNLSKLKEDDIVNLEFDAISKYLESLLENKEGETKYAYLVERGFI